MSPRYRLYTTLPADEAHIRLIQIKPGDRCRPDECILSVHKLSKAPEYSAVSYVWGDATVKASFIINGLSVKIGANCHYILWQLRNLNLARYYWIDALCINQEDLVEKSSQVPLMGRIYGTALLVLACIGPNSANSLNFMKTIQTIPIQHHGEYADLNSRRDRKHEAKRTNEVRIWSNNYSPKQLHNLLVAGTDFAERSFWTRLWIVQEMVLAANILLVCGLYTIEWYYIANFYTNTRNLRECLSRGMGARTAKIIEDPQVDAISEKAENVTSIVDIRDWSTSERRLFPLAELISRFRRNWQCSNALDRVYSLLALMDNSHAMAKITADYTKSTFSLAMQCMQCIDILRYDVTVTSLQHVGTLAEVLTLTQRNSEVLRHIETRRQHYLELCTKRETYSPGRLSEEEYHASRLISAAENGLGDFCTFFDVGIEADLIEQSSDGGLTTKYDFSPARARDWSNPPEQASMGIERIYSIAVAYAERLAADWNSSIDAKPQLLKHGSHCIGILCSRARPGDYWIQWSESLDLFKELSHFCRLCLVVRRSRESSRLFEIVGQGFMSIATGLYFPKYDPRFQVRLCLDNEDLLVFASQDLGDLDISEESWNTGTKPSIDMPLQPSQIQRLFTHFTKTTFSSFAIERDPSSTGPSTSE